MANENQADIINGGDASNFQLDRIQPGSIFLTNGKRGCSNAAVSPENSFGRGLCPRR
jgi:hypothetical protein